MNPNKLADLLEAAARELRKLAPASRQAGPGRGMTTTQLAKETRLHPNTIRAMVARKEIVAHSVGGSHGYEFPPDSVETVRSVLRSRHQDRLKKARKNRAANASEKSLAKAK